MARLLRHDPVPWLLSSDDRAITTFVERDLLGEEVDTKKLGEAPEAQRVLRRQQTDGAWRYPREKPSPYNYDLYETLNALGVLVSKYGFDRRHPAVAQGAAYVFSCQAPEGDYRGIFGNQPDPTHTPILMEVLIEAGFQQHESIERAFRWLLETRQDDGGWAIPARTRGKKLAGDWEGAAFGDPIEPDRSKPFSHVVTGMVLRAFAAHPRYRGSQPANDAATMLKTRFFKSDKYPDRRGREYWTKFTFPFTYPDILTSLDTLGRMGLSADDPDIGSAIAWFEKKQKPDGSFDLDMRRGTSDERLPYWLGLAICRALRRFEPTRLGVEAGGRPLCQASPPQDPDR
ncbi:MAG: hypothetical protein CL694_09975 [Chloroflexi bacterium]|nr:hypothetical protein [Chloroflexota bacterium]MDP6422622.1 terpene cyclase/mutase family protein [SAR202 cluster bacterium]HAL46484.1 hypothetical protein [Dehalococcoidia bacterium]